SRAARRLCWVRWTRFWWTAEQPSRHRRVRARRCPDRNPPAPGGVYSRDRRRRRAPRAPLRSSVTMKIPLPRKLQLMFAVTALAALGPAAQAGASQGQQTFFEAPALLLNPSTRPATLA